MRVPPLVLVAGIAIPLVGDPDPASEARALVDDAHLAMRAVVVRPGLQPVERPEPSDVHACLVHHRDEGTVERFAAEGVEQHSHPYARARSSRKVLGELGPDATLPVDEGQEVDRPLRAVDRFEHRREHLDAIAEHVDLVAVGRRDADEALDRAAQLSLCVIGHWSPAPLSPPWLPPRAPIRRPSLCLAARTPAPSRLRAARSRRRRRATRWTTAVPRAPERDDAGERSVGLAERRAPAEEAGEQHGGNEPERACRRALRRRATTNAAGAGGATTSTSNARPAAARTRPSGHRATCHAVSTSPPSSETVWIPPYATRCERRREECADDESEQEREAVLLRGRAIGLDAVDAIERAFELPEEGRGGEEAAREAERDRDGLVTVAGLLRLARRCGEQLDPTGRVRSPGCAETTASLNAVLLERAREADEGDRALDDDEHAQERERLRAWLKPSATRRRLNASTRR